ncbi:hypothetical protein [Thalassotalea ganghwensis]
MNNKTNVPFWFTLAAIIAILWNLIGAFAFISQVNLAPEQLATMPVEHQEYYNTMPLWATMAFAIAVGSGVLASIVLLMKKQWALHLYGLSIVGIVIQNVHAFLIADAYQILGQESLILPSIVFTIAILLFWLAFHAKNKNWLS